MRKGLEMGGEDLFGRRLRGREQSQQFLHLLPESGEGVRRRAAAVCYRNI